MKKFLLLTLSISFLFIINACQKETPFDSEKVLTHHEWILESNALNGAFLPGSGGVGTDTFWFYPDHTYERHNLNSYVPNEFGNWNIDQEEGKLLFEVHYNSQEEDDFYEMEYLIFQLTNSTLTFGTLSMDDNGVATSFQSTYKAGF